MSRVPRHATKPRAGARAAQPLLASSSHRGRRRYLSLGQGGRALSSLSPRLGGRYRIPRISLHHPCTCSLGLASPSSPLFWSHGPDSETPSDYDHAVPTLPLAHRLVLHRPSARSRRLPLAFKARCLACLPRRTSLRCLPRPSCMLKTSPRPRMYRLRTSSLHISRPSGRMNPLSLARFVLILRLRCTLTYRPRILSAGTLELLLCVSSSYVFQSPYYVPSPDVQLHASSEVSVLRLFHQILRRGWD